MSAQKAELRGARKLARKGLSGRSASEPARDVVLLISGDTDEAHSIRAALLSADGCAFTVEWVRTCSHGIERLASGLDPTQGAGRLTAIIVDLELPDSSGLETFARLFSVAPHLPVLVLCSLHNEIAAKAAVQQGAQDYLLKSHLNSYLLHKTLSGALDRAAILETLFNERELAQVTLASIGDAVISTDVDGFVMYLNVVAERLTGWSRKGAYGQRFEEIFKIIDAGTRARLPNPAQRAMRENKTVGLSANCILIRRDGFESAIEDSSAPIHDRRGNVVGAVIVFRDVSAARALTLKLAYLAHHDSLTGLANRALLHERLTEAIAVAAVQGWSLAVLYLDLDRFKKINDSLGHAVGDRLLQAVAQRIKNCMRATDTVSRQGGDEFVILMTKVTPGAGVQLCAQKLLEAIRVPYLLEHEVYTTASIGMAFYPHDGLDAETLLDNADCAMYEAKRCGRNSYQTYRAGLNEGAGDRRLLENGLRHAIEREEFVIHYQPTVDLITGAIAGAEALIRWQHPSRGLLYPTQFIPIAEESGLIVPIGQWVLREACRQAKVWSDAQLPAFTLAVNVSAVEPQSSSFVSHVSTILAETGFDPGRLELEITETFLMQDSASTTVVLETLKSLGVRFALDDFGTGYSSLSHMRCYPIDALKVDKSFVQELSANADDANVVNAIINMGRNLHMRVIAEGVESREQLHYLQSHECPEAQGNWFSPPLAPDAFAELLGRGLKAS